MGPIEQTDSPLKQWFRGISLRDVGRFLLQMLVGALGFAVLMAVLLRFFDPPFSSEMLRAKFHGEPVTYRWVPLEAISPNLVKAVIMAEDARYCLHNGVDWRQMEQAWQEVLEGDQKPRGASTITMQTVKNLFLWSDRSYIRKAIEMPFSFLVDFVWPKRRQMEIYLNIVEWGPGIYGAHAAARYHFKVAPDRLTSRQAAQLAASLPNPIGRRAGRPGPLTRRIAGIIHKRMAGADPWVKCALP